ncbi:cytosolic sulfotransferase 12-like [Pistacia vera]|uniref:cytosolic sulfotransferase 12-like n=1 Tax=Pistacia vera TaxID=55513 RepID=UPI0012637F89|nr:cytosolic sulfotransferase 12-like [Pistacia vera]
MPTENVGTSTDDLPKYLQEHCLTQECHHLLSSLPSETGWVADHLYQYQGFWHHVRQLQGVLTCRNHLQAQDSDILLVSTPKAGTTWLKAIIFALVNRLRYVDDPQQHPLLTNNPHELVPFLELQLYVDNQVPDLTNLATPRLFATHLPFVLLPTSVKDSACKVVYLCRNPKDTFVSLWHFANKLRPAEKGKNCLEEIFDRFCRGVSICGPFWDHVLGYWKASLEFPERVMFLKYEDMKEEPEVHVRRLAEFLGCPFSAEEETKGLVDSILKLCSFDHLSNLEVNRSGKMSSGEEYNFFFRRGEIGDSENLLTSEMIERLDQITEQKWHGFGLKF